jgi:hypothetical protein
LSGPIDPEEIRRLVSANELRRAVDLLLDATRSDPTQNDTARLISKQLAELEEPLARSLLGAHYDTREVNIAQSILKMTRSLRPVAVSSSVPPSPAPRAHAPAMMLAPVASAPAPRSPTTAAATPAPVTGTATAGATVPLPNRLIDAFRGGTLAPFLGAGASLSAGVAGDFPLWKDVPLRLLEEAARLGLVDPTFIDNKRRTFAAPMPLRTMLAELGVLKVALDRDYRDAMNRIFRPADAAPGPLHRALAELHCRLVLTANIDQLIEKSDPTRQAFTWRQAPDLLSDLNDGRDVLFKVHGSVETLNSLVMTQDEYDTASRNKPYQRTLSHLLQSYSFLFVGFSLVDPLDLERVLESNAHAFKHAARPHFALMKSPVGSNADRWRADFNVQPIEYSNHADVIDILRRLKTP